MEEIINIVRQAFARMALTSDDVFNLFFSLLLAFMIAIVISQIYKITHRGVNYELTFMTSLVLLAPIVALVMMFISGNLVVSLGLVGSLAIIRFRTPIKDTRDMVFLFWSIAVGLGAGTYSWGMVILASLFLAAAFYFLYIVKYGSSKNNDYILVLSGQSDFLRESIQSVIKNYALNSKMRSLKVDGDVWEVVYELQFDVKNYPDEKLTQELKNVVGVENISLLAPQLAIPV